MNHDLLLEPPRRIPGGVSFTINAVQHGQTVFVTDAALAALAPAAETPQDVVRYVMMHSRQLAGRALTKVDGGRIAQLIVLDLDDVR